MFLLSFNELYDKFVVLNDVWVHVASVNILYPCSGTKNCVFLKKINNLVSAFCAVFFHLSLISSICSLCLSELGLLMKSCIDQGQLVPDDVISRLILKDLRSLENSSWLLDGGSRLCFGHKHVCVFIIIIFYRWSETCESAGQVVLALLSWKGGVFSSTSLSF